MQEDSKPIYRYCIVPMCKNTNRNAPNKVFFFVPRGADTRRKWCEVMKRDMIKPSTSLFCCEDHFDLEEDTANYIQYKIMHIEQKQKTVLRLKKGILPHKFQCQENTEPHLPSLPAPSKPPRPAPSPPEPSLKRPKNNKRKHLEIIEEPASPAKQSVSATKPTESNDQIEASTPSSQIYTEDIDMKNLWQAGCSASLYAENKMYIDAAVQVHSKIYHRTKGVNVNLCAKKKNQAISPFQIARKTISTSPLKITPNTSVCKRALFKDNLADTASVTSAQSSMSSYYLSSSSFEPEISSSESSCIEEVDALEAQFKSQMRTFTLLSIEKEPKLLIGVPKRSYYLIKLLSDNIPLPIVDILISLKKIKLNESFRILALQFGYSPSTISRICSKSIPVMAMTMKQMITWQTSAQVFKNLPIAFRARYSNVVSIIDCLEIQIEKPTNAIYQALTWSQYKKCNTLKYLISCTPDGLVTFISDGYGGRATDVMIVEDCGFLNNLQPNTEIMADKGFKDLSRLLVTKNCSLIRPPSVSKGTACTKEEVKQAKRIATLRIHVEHVINRLREFHTLLPHACVDHNLIPIIDEIIIIACGLINMQDYLIKK